EGLGVAPHRGMDGLGSTLAEPCPEDSVEGAPFRGGEVDHELVAGVAATALDRGSPSRVPVSPDMEAVELAAIGHEPAVTGTAARACRLMLPRLPVEVAQDPLLALPQERMDTILGPGPAATCRRRHGDDEAISVVDGHAEAPRAMRPSQAVLHRAFAEPDRRARRLDLRDGRLSHHGES